MKNVYWLASYPKSGNTWMRAFLSNYWQNGDAPADINDLQHTFVLSARAPFDDALGIDSGLLTHAEIDALRPAVYRSYASNGERHYWKTHDACQRLESGEPMFPADITAGVIYILRTPFDVAISYAHHNHATVDEAIEWMRDDEHGLTMTKTNQIGQLHQRICSWSTHVRSWTEQTDLPLLVVRYEDMIAEPFGTFSQVVGFVGGDPADEDRLAKAIRFSSFKELRNQELARGFKEKTQMSESFFRQGKAGGWRSTLTDAQIERIIQDHQMVMQRFGYLNSLGEVVL